MSSLFPNNITKSGIVLFILMWSDVVSCSTTRRRESCTCDYPVFTSYFENTYCGNITACYSSIAWYIHYVPNADRSVLPTHLSSEINIINKIKDLWKQVPIFQLPHFKSPCDLPKLDECRNLQTALLNSECKRLFPELQVPPPAVPRTTDPAAKKPIRPLFKRWTHWGRPQGTWLWGASLKKHKETSFLIKGKRYWKDGCPDGMHYPTFTFNKLAKKESNLHYDEYQMLEEYVPKSVPHFFIQAQTCKFMQIMTHKVTPRFILKDFCNYGILKQVICPKLNKTGGVAPFDIDKSCGVHGKPVSINYRQKERL